MAEVLQKLKAILEGNDSEHLDRLPIEPNFNYAVNRLDLSYNSKKSLTPDDIVLLRQCIRWSGMKGIRIDKPSVESDQLENWLQKADLKWSQGGYLSANPYAPDWLMEEISPVLDNPPNKCIIDESYTGEHYLKQIGYEKWRSQAQKEGAWMVVTAPPGATRTIVLPTGYGKSLCFQLLPLFSFGLTVVVVPTVALAIDQCYSASNQLKNLPNVNPCYFSSNEDTQEFVNKLKNKESRLVFASPETCVSGYLRPILDEHAKNGWFQNLVIDEAHLIETWGSFFRVEFQILAACRREWLEQSHGHLRTFLFSATMSTRCRETLASMFVDSDHGDELVCQRLRPEIKYFGRWFRNQDERWPFVCEAIWHLPRPLILYVTTREDANYFSSKIKEEGFQRMGSFTGETQTSLRKELLEKWRENKIDLMVATSAFGVGVDKGDVRTILHACYPENLDRYYQEVGRSGRDGYSSICLLMPTKKDKKIAKNLGRTILRDANKIQERWESMYGKAEKEQDEDYVYKLPLTVKRKGLIGHPTFRKNIRWNKSLLLQLFRAKQIDFLNLEYRRIENSDDQVEELAKVKLYFPPNIRRVADLITNVNNEELSRFDQNFRQLEEVLSGQHCVSWILKRLYGVATDQRICGGCRSCRSRGIEIIAQLCPPLKVPKKQIQVARYKGYIIEACPNPIQLSQIDDFIDMIEICAHKISLRPLQVYCPENHFEKIFKILEGVFRQYKYPYRFDPFNKDTVILPSNDNLIFIHIENYSKCMLKKGIQQNSNHLFCGVNKIVDPNGRHIRINYNYDKWASHDAWLGEIS